MIVRPSVRKKVVAIRGNRMPSFKTEGVASCTRSAKRKRDETVPCIKGSRKVKKSDDLESFTCGICFDDDCTDRGVIDCCDHKFCHSCLKTWMKRSSSCPHCKRQVKTITRLDRYKRRLVEKVDKRLLRDTIEREEGLNMGRVIVLGPVRSYQSQRFFQDPRQVYNMLIGLGSERYVSNGLRRGQAVGAFAGNGVGNAYVLSPNAAAASRMHMMGQMGLPRARQTLISDNNMLAPDFVNPVSVSTANTHAAQFECNFNLIHGASPGIRSVPVDYASASRRIPVHPFLGSPFAGADMSQSAGWNGNAVNSVPFSASSRLAETTPYATCLFQQTHGQINQALNIQALLTSPLFGGSNML